MRFLIAVIDSQSNSGTTDEMVAIDEFNDMLVEKDHMIMACGIDLITNAYVLDNRLDAGISTAGPLHLSDEFMAGFWLIKANSLEQAKELAAQGSKACNRKVEVRLLHG